MANSHLYRVTWHCEKSGKRATETFQHNVVAAAQDQNTIFTVLNNNSLIPSGYTQANFVVETIGHVSSVPANGVYS